ncbi:DUF1275 domain-containing protein [Ancylobacter sp. 6x-1]|uniref:DUF1275 domain-containing protein n=1 Tax=Ancylobacter crimeensis TaxID=2579147 RepID=A0ABT0DAT7_9HYPH|nr:YoaK family protein [Ancylobacter crimeensis]MCK0197067.1 DUF1275 domain-containing protein [Ancylobacter crimeensis]
MPIEPGRDEPGRPALATTRAGSVLFATAITGLAGYVDAVGYAHIGNLYLSFMSGNSTRLGLALGNLDGKAVLWVGAIIALFVLGAALGTYVCDAAPTRRISAILATETLLFVLALLLLTGTGWAPALLPVAAAMGLQNAIHQSVHGADIGKSFVTGALFSLGQSIANALRGKGTAGACAFYALSWGTFVLGAATGAVTLAAIGLPFALAAATIGVAALAAVAMLLGT